MDGQKVLRLSPIGRMKKPIRTHKRGPRDIEISGNPGSCPIILDSKKMTRNELGSNFKAVFGPPLFLTKKVVWSTIAIEAMHSKAVISIIIAIIIGQTPRAFVV